MNFPALILLLIEFLPQIAGLLRELFGKAQLTGSMAGLDTPTAIREAFAATRRQTWVWQLGARSKLRVGERLALAHAYEFAVALRNNGPAPALTASERVEILAA